MSDVLRGGPGGLPETGLEAETPINPYSLLGAVNSSSDTAHMGWLIFLAIMTYLTVAVAGVTHKDLMLQTPVALPLLQVQIQQTQFFQFAPIILVLMHLGLVSQLVLLAKKTLEFDGAVRALEATDLRTHPLRLELHNFFFVQAIAGPHRSRVMSAFLHGMSWLTLVILPVILLLYIQITFVPFHDRTITWTHRIALLLDIAMLGMIGIFLMRAETSFPRALAQTSRNHPMSFVITGFVLALAALFSLFVATIPGEPLERMVAGLQPRQPQPPARQGSAPSPAGFAIPFVGARADGSLFGMFHRNLIVTDTELAADRRKGGTDEGAPISLRGRDLRYARLDRAVLARADLTGADLEGASLVGADLRDARLACPDISQLLLTDNRVEAGCPTARGANLSRAVLSGASLAGIDLRGARLEEAMLDGSDLSASILAGANFYGAHLEKANLSGSVQAQGVNFLVANLQGADLTGAQLQLADLTSAAMQGVVLAHAGLEGAVLRDADLEAADMTYARLQGVDMAGTRLKAADLRGARVWMTQPPALDALHLADLGDLAIQPLEPSEVQALGQMIDRLDRPALKEQVRGGLAAIMNLSESRKWAGSGDQQRWHSHVGAASAASGEAYRGQLTDFLVRLMCKSRWSNGSIATGIAMRAEKQNPPFRGDMLAIHDKLRAKDCAPGEAVAKRAMQKLSIAADAARDK
jgi:uncharacterized protein YjbI with pentapeptide repeats